MRNVDPEKYKPEHSGGELGLQGLSSHCLPHSWLSHREVDEQRDTLGFGDEAGQGVSVPGTEAERFTTELSLSFAIDKPPKKLNLKPQSCEYLLWSKMTLSAVFTTSARRPALPQHPLTLWTHLLTHRPLSLPTTEMRQGAGTVRS